MREIAGRPARDETIVDYELLPLDDVVALFVDALLRSAASRHDLELDDKVLQIASAVIRWRRDAGAAALRALLNDPREDVRRLATEWFAERDTRRHLIERLIESVPAASRDLVDDTYWSNTAFPEGTLDPSARLEIGDFSQCLWLSSFESRTRRNGHASRVLRHVCHLADIYGVTLALEPEAYTPFGRETPMAEDGFLTTEELVAWYARHGFRLHSTSEYWRHYYGDGIVMQRQPRRPAHAATDTGAESPCRGISPFL